MLDRPRANYLSDIQSCLDYMHAGESYEICLTNKLRRRYSTDIDPRKFYTMLRKINPAPYAAFLSFGSADLSVCCSSPERFLRGDRGAVLEAKPIKGEAFVLLQLVREGKQLAVLNCCCELQVVITLLVVYMFSERTEDVCDCRYFCTSC